MCRYKKQVTISRFSVEGNNGGDTLEIELLEDGRLHLSVGHCCVREIDHVVPVEFITALLTQIVIKYGSVEAAMAAIECPAEFKQSLIAKIERS